MCMYFKTENLIEYFFLTLAVRRPFLRKEFMRGKYGDTGLLSEKTEDFHAELDERAEVAASCYSAEFEFLRYIYSMLVVKNY